VGFGKFLVAKSAVPQDFGDDLTRRRFRAVSPVTPPRTKSKIDALPSVVSKLHLNVSWIALWILNSI
jgi:hypothetical protein